MFADDRSSNLSYAPPCSTTANQKELRKFFEELQPTIKNMNI